MENYKGFIIKHRPKHSDKDLIWIAGKIKLGLFDVSYYASTLKKLKNKINQV